MISSLVRNCSFGAGVYPSTLKLLVRCEPLSGPFADSATDSTPGKAASASMSRR
jgi:hypothetical protein